MSTYFVLLSVVANMCVFSFLFISVFFFRVLKINNNKLFDLIMCRIAM